MVSSTAASATPATPAGRLFFFRQVLELDRRDVSVLVLLDEHEVDDLDRAVVDDLAQSRRMVDESPLEQTDEAARRYGASPEEETQEAEVAYARFPDAEPTQYREGWLPSSQKLGTAGI